MFSKVESKLANPHLALPFFPLILKGDPCLVLGRNTLIGVADYHEK